MNGWQPKSTAPRDGTRVLLWNGHYASVGCWKEEADFGNSTEDEDRRPGWQVFDCEMDQWYSVALKDEDVTHWQPLPDGPY